MLPFFSINIMKKKKKKEKKEEEEKPAPDGKQQIPPGTVFFLSSVVRTFPRALAVPSVFFTFAAHQSLAALHVRRQRVACAHGRPLYIVLVVAFVRFFLNGIAFSPNRQ